MFFPFFSPPSGVRSIEIAFCGDRFNQWTSKANRINSVKVAQFCGKTADLATLSVTVGASDGSCSDAMTLTIADWLFHAEGGTYSAILHVAVSHLHSNACGPSWHKWNRVVKRLIAINRIQNKRFCLHICVYCVYLLCIYKHTHIQYIFWKYLHVLTCIYLYNLYYIYYILNI